MLKREIKYKNFDGEEETGIFYFNISQPEMLEMEVKYDQGFGKMIQAIVEAKNQKELVDLFKEIILKAYGVKSDDGKYFEKSEELSKKFSQSAAYNVLFMELATDDKAATIFMRGIMPAEFVEAADKAEKAELQKKTAEKLGTVAPTE
jgi:hypothetical protein